MQKMKGRTAVFLALTILGATLLFPAMVRAQEIPPPPAGAEAYPGGLIHTVVEGDTLWDLAAKYLGSPWKWTELWERNRFLTNPHYIYPGIHVVIFPPPEKDYALAKEAPPEAPAKAAEPVPVPSKVAPPPGPATLDILPAEFVRAGDFLKEKPSGIGAIRGGEDPRVSFSEGDKVHLALTKEIPGGQLLGVYRVRGPVTSPGVLPGSGYVKYLVGIIQSTGKQNGEAYGVVRKSFEDLVREDLISEEIPSYSPVPLSAGPSGKEATVVAGQWENEEQSDRNFVFLDRGSSSGVSVGNVFRLMNFADESDGTTPVLQSSALMDVGVAVIVRTRPDSSTAFVTGSRRSFPAGVKAIGAAAELGK